MHMIDVMKKLSEIAENYDNEDIQAGIVAAGKTHSVVAEETVQEGAVKDMMQDVEEGMTKAEFEKKYPGQDYDAIKKDIEEKMDESKEANVEEVHEDVESDETELDRMLYLGGVMGSSSNNIMIKENIEEASVEEAAQDGVVEIGYDANSTTFKTPYGEVTANYSSNSRAYDDFDADNNQLGDVLNNMDQHPSFDMSDGINHDNVEDYITMSVKKMSSMDEADVQETVEDAVEEGAVEEASLDEEEYGNHGRAAADILSDRSSVTLDMVAPAIKKMYAEYKADAEEWHGNYKEMENEIRANDPNISDKALQREIRDMDDDIVSYVNVNDLEGKIDAIEYLMKMDNADGNDIVGLIDDGPPDTAAREQFSGELKRAINQNHPEVYSKLFMYGVDESVEEGAVEEASVEVPVQELQDILQLAGYENYAEKIEEYANEPDEEYGDAQEQMVGLSGGLNGPKTHYPAAAGGDNPMAVKALKVTDDVYEGFYSKYDKFVKEFNEENK